MKLGSFMNIIKYDDYRGGYNDSYFASFDENGHKSMRKFRNNEFIK